VSRPAGDTGGADPAVTAVLAAYAAGGATEHAVLTTLAASRLLVPVVAVLVEATDPVPGHAGTSANEAGAAARGSVNADQGSVGQAMHGQGSGATGASARQPGDTSSAGAACGGGDPASGALAPGPAGRPGLRAEKETEMALPTLIGNDGRKAVIAFTGADAVRRWRADARPVPVPAARLWPAVAAEQADAVVIDVAGPVPLVIEGARLRALAGGAPPPLPHQDPDIRAQVAAVTADFTLEPGGEDADLTIIVKAPDLAAARVAAEAIAARLAPRLRRGVAIRVA
jgi:hypothetical protein